MLGVLTIFNTVTGIGYIVTKSKPWKVALLIGTCSELAYTVKDMYDAYKERKEIDKIYGA